MGWCEVVLLHCLYFFVDILLFKLDISEATRLQKVVFNTHATSIINKEYCMAEFFKPKCDQNEVITMLKADFGRMSTGQCIEEENINESNRHTLGCASNELGLFDRLCSGRRSCEILIPSPEMEVSTGCNKDLMRYLDASYRCQKVLTSEQLSCDTSLAYPLEGPSGLISSTSVLEAQCDDQAASFIIETNPGQSVNFTLFDYGWTSDRLTPSEDSCHFSYGYIANVATLEIIHICGGKARVKPVASVQSKQVQIVLKPTSIDQPQFVLKYEVIGCSDAKLPSNSWSKREGPNLIVGCNHSGNEHTWKLMCQGNTWIGTMGNCYSKPFKAIVAEPVQQASKDSEVSDDNKNSVLSANGALILIIVGSCTLGIILVVIAVGVICIKKQSPRKKKEKKEKKKKPKKNYPPLPPKSAVLRPPNSNRNSTVTYQSVCLDNLPPDHPMFQSFMSEPGGSLKYEHLMNRSLISQDGSLKYEHPMVRSVISADGGSLKYENLMSRSLISDGSFSMDRPSYAGNRNSVTAAAIRSLNDQQPEYFILERPITIAS